MEVLDMFQKSQAHKLLMIHDTEMELSDSLLEVVCVSFLSLLRSVKEKKLCWKSQTYRQGEQLVAYCWKTSRRPNTVPKYNSEPHQTT